MPYVVYIKAKKGMTRGGLVRTPGRRVLVSKTKVEAERLRKAAIEKYNVPKKHKKLVNSLVKVRKL